MLESTSAKTRRIESIGRALTDPPMHMPYLLPPSATPARKHVGDREAREEGLIFSGEDAPPPFLSGVVAAVEVEAPNSICM
mmetsp:Transcript_11859/g.37093  ORF Transcript_11859/g.37093 Transcript_11859/m.37093 type:complete len:81 (+) Transcript_11859:25-267(+)